MLHKISCELLISRWEQEKLLPHASLPPAVFLNLAKVKKKKFSKLSKQFLLNSTSSVRFSVRLKIIKSDFVIINANILHELDNLIHLDKVFPSYLLWSCVFVPEIHQELNWNSLESLKWLKWIHNENIKWEKFISF